MQNASTLDLGVLWEYYVAKIIVREGIQNIGNVKHKMKKNEVQDDVKIITIFYTVESEKNDNT